jgi:hypothetical protein
MKKQSIMLAIIWIIFTWLDTPEGIASIKELEDIVVNDDDWEFSDD